MNVNPRDPNRQSDLAQTEEYSCGPLTIVKFVDLLFRLNNQRDVKFTGICAKQRIIDENWNVLRNSVPFQIRFESEECKETLDHSWNQAWHQKSANEKILVTDQHCIDYVMRTLVKSWTDMIAYKELDDSSTDNYFLVKECDMSKDD